MNTWKVILATLVIFGAGVVTGGLLVSYAVRVKPVLHVNKPLPSPQAMTPWQQRSRELLRRMERDLDLTADQVKRVEKHIAESSERTKGLWKPIAPQMSKEMMRLHREIREELTPEQGRKFDELSKPRPNQEKRRMGTNFPPSLDSNSTATNRVPVAQP